LSLRLVLTPVPLVPVALVPVAALVRTALGAVHSLGERARGVLWFGRMR
jgi:hypothetical protein